MRFVADRRKSSDRMRDPGRFRFVSSIEPQSVLTSSTAHAFDFGSNADTSIEPRSPYSE
jgi:hypothetical protein